MVMELASNPGLGSSLILGKFHSISKSPRVDFVAIQAIFRLLQTLASAEVKVLPFVLEEEAFVAEPTRRQIRGKLNFGNVLPRA